MRILLKKLLTSVLACMSRLSNDCSFITMREELDRWEYWRQLAAGQVSRSPNWWKADDWIDVDAMELAACEISNSPSYYGMWDVVVKDVRVDFTKMSSHNKPMITWKHVMSRYPQFKEKAEKFLKRGLARHHGNRAQGRNLPEMQEVMTNEEHPTKLQNLRREVQQLQTSV